MSARERRSSLQHLGLPQARMINRIASEMTDPRPATPPPIPWRPIAEFDGTEGTLALVWGRWHGEVASSNSNSPLEAALCRWSGTQWDCQGGDYYSSWMTDVAQFALVQPPQTEPVT